MHPAQQDPIRFKYFSKLGMNPAQIMLKRNSEIEIPSQKTKPSNRRVRFQTEVCIQEIPSLEEYSQYAKSQVWYTGQELHELAVLNAMEDLYYGNNRMALDMDPWATAAAAAQERQQEGAFYCDQAFAAAMISAAVQKENQMYVFPLNKGLAIRNASLRPPAPPVRPDAMMYWPQYV